MMIYKCHLDFSMMIFAQGANQALEDAFQLGRFIKLDGGGFNRLEEFRWKNSF